MMRVHSKPKPNSPRPGPGRGGVTLVEAMVAVTVLAILSMCTSALYIQALKMYQQGTRESTSRDKAALALEQMMSEIREAYNVDYPGPAMIVFTMPKEDSSGRYAVDSTTHSLKPGRQVAFYQGNRTATYDTEGEYIWKISRDDWDSYWYIDQCVQTDVEDLSFVYSPSTELLELVRVAVTVGQGEHPGYFNRTEVQEVWVRNH